MSFSSDDNFLAVLECEKYMEDNFLELSKQSIIEFIIMCNLVWHIEHF